MLDFEGFQDAIISEFKRTHPEANEEFIKFMKDDNKASCTIVIPEETIGNIEIRRLLPEVHLDDHFNAYVEKRSSLQDILRSISLVYKSNFSESSCKRIRECIRLINFKDYKEVRSLLRFKLVNRDRNAELLKSVIHVPFLDLETVFYVDIRSDWIEAVTIPVRNEHLALWNVDLDTLKEDAYANIPDAPAIAMRIGDALSIMMGVAKSSDAADGRFHIPASAPVYVLTRSGFINGSACMLYPGVLKDFAESDGIKSNLFLIPSSQNEILLLPVDACGFKIADLKQLIQHVNNTALSPEDILSYEVYFYDRETDLIRIEKD